MTNAKTNTLKATRRKILLGLTASLVISAPRLDAIADSNDDPFPLQPFNYKKLPVEFRPTVVDYKSRQWPGTVIVDTSA